MVARFQNFVLLGLVTAALACTILGCHANTSHIGKKSLTAADADQIIPNGMTRSNVLAILGPNGIAVPDASGATDILYWFQFFPPPPKANPKIDSIMIEFSNNIVIGRTIPDVKKY